MIIFDMKPRQASLRLRQKLIRIDFQFAAKKADFQDNFFQFQIFLSFILYVFQVREACY